MDATEKQVRMVTLDPLALEVLLVKGDLEVLEDDQEEWELQE